MAIHPHKRVAAAVVLVSVLMLLFWLSAVFQKTFFEWFSVLEEYAKTHENEGMILFVLFATLSVLLGPFSSVPLVPLAVGVWGTTITFILLYVGWFLGGMLSYAVGYYWGYPLVKHLVPVEKIHAWRKELGNKLEFFILILFRIATPSETGYVFGILRYSFPKYLFITALSELPFAFLVVRAGDAFVTRQPAIFLGFIGIGVLLIVLTVFFLRIRLLTREIAP
jgi:uncharacterized membrane protein YdjX (TVP38/TMEM64 family)